jgi:ankyrin repeat protein
LNPSNPNIELAKLLLERGANVNAKQEEYNWKGSGASVDTLIRMNLTHMQKTAFELALNIAIKQKDEKLLELFLKHGGNANIESVRGAHTMRYDGTEKHRPIHMAARSSSASCLRILLANGAEVDARATNKGFSEYGSGSDTSETALHIAAGELSVFLNEWTYHSPITLHLISI